MARGLNKAMIIGNLGRDPELRYTPAGRPIASFSVVVERERASAEAVELDWFTVVAWDSLAEACGEQLKRDRLVYVEGRLQTRSFRRGDQTHYRSEVVAEVVIPLEVLTPSVSEEEGEGEARAELPKTDEAEPLAIEGEFTPAADVLGEPVTGGQEEPTTGGQEEPATDAEEAVTPPQEGAAGPGDGLEVENI